MNRKAYVIKDGFPFPATSWESRLPPTVATEVLNGLIYIYRAVDEDLAKRFVERRKAIERICCSDNKDNFPNPNHALARQSQRGIIPVGFHTQFELAWTSPASSSLPRWTTATMRWQPNIRDNNMWRRKRTVGGWLADTRHATTMRDI